ncbi:MAG: HAD-IIIC family phosphatase [candidate division Zixibacteria bacterium]|nr:HAD-IIIC family phosphatase [candidate division Zixibacteria bacterium]
MTDLPLRCLLLADFTVDNLAGLLTNDETSPHIEAVSAPFGQVVPVLLDDHHECWQPKPDAVVIWTRPQAVIPSFQRVLEFEQVETEEVLGEVDQYAAMIAAASRRTRAVLIPKWTIPQYIRGWGMLDMQSDLGVANLLARMNLRLVDQLAHRQTDSSNVFILNASRWMILAGKHACNPKLWYLGKVAFGNEVLMAAVNDIKAAMAGILGQARKLIIVDLDDTLWGGIVGEIGYENLRLGGHDPIGEAFVDFQRTLKSLTRRGLLLAIVSKNEESTALEAINNHTEMVLAEDDFVSWRINWDDKARNIAELVEQLNLGLQSTVFIDDNPVERDRVKAALPEILVPDWPSDPMLYTSTLLAMNCFDTPTVSVEDMARTKMYRAEQHRSNLVKKVGSLEEWLASLQIKVTVEPLGDLNRERSVQLLNKTNQMNMTTRRLTDDELSSWVENDNHWLRTFRVEDKFGDSGLTGIVSCEIDGHTAHIVDFLLSCRVLGRKIEETMLHAVIAHARSRGVSEILAQPIPTKRNNPCREFFAHSGFGLDKDGQIYRWAGDKDYPLPKEITLIEG